MNLRESISHPELLVGSDGSVFHATSGQRINLIRDHGRSIRGHMVAYRHNGKLKQISVIRLVFEAHIKKAKIQTNDYVETLDGDDYNPMANNLTSGQKFRKPEKRIKRLNVTGEVYETWLNGHTELYC